MRNTYFISLLFVWLTCLSHAWIIEDPIDYNKLKVKSDFCGIVQLVSVEETGRVKDIYGKGVKYREMNFKLKVLSSIKGEGPKVISVSIYRVPTEEELTKDGDADPRLTHLQESISEANHIYLVKAVKDDVLMVYLKGKSKGGFHCVTGDSKQSHSIFVMESSSTIRSKAMLKAARN